MPSTSATMFLWIQHKINPDFWEGRHGVATLFNFLSNICVFRLDWVFAQQHSSQTIRNNWTNGAVAKKSKNIYETSEDLSYLWWASTFSLLPYFSPFFSNVAVGLCAGFVLDVTLSLLCLDMLDLAVSCPRVSRTSHSCLSKVLEVEASWENPPTMLLSVHLAFSLLYFLLLHLLETFPTLPSSNYLILICRIFIVVSCSIFCALFSESFLCFISVTFMSPSHTACKE